MTIKHTITETEKQNLLEMYYKGIKFEEMYAKTKIPKRQIQKFFKDRNMELVKRYRVSENYFDIINSENKAYWLGYLYCDGFVGQGKYNNIVLSSVDEHVIDLFIDDVILEGKSFVKKVKPTEMRKGSYGVNTLYEARFSSKEMKQALIKQNVFTNRKTKSFIKYTNIEDKYLKNLLFGILDADAYVSIKLTKGNRSYIQLYSSSELLDEYENFLKKLGLKYTVKYHEEKDCYYLGLLFSDTNTNKLIDEYIKRSLMYRKIAPSLLKNSVE